VSVYVDPLAIYPSEIACFQGGSCHLYADTLEELHAFAARLGMKRAWFQDRGRLPHYDLALQRRTLAVRLGAIEHTRREAGMFWRERYPRKAEPAPTTLFPMGGHRHE
jgi:hypothetical protein